MPTPDPSQGPSPRQTRSMSYAQAVSPRASTLVPTTTGTAAAVQPPTNTTPAPSPPPCCNCRTPWLCKARGCECWYQGRACTNCPSKNCTNKHSRPRSSSAPPTPRTSNAATPTTIPATQPTTLPPAPAPSTTPPTTLAAAPTPAPAPSATPTSAPVGPTLDPTPARSDLLSYQPTAADAALDDIYGDHVHANDGTHLAAGIPDDQLWQSYYRSLVAYNPSEYHLPNNSIGKQFITILADLLDGIRLRHHNAEKFLIFPIVILQRCHSITKADDVKKRIQWRLQLWTQGKYKLLVQETTKDMHHLLSRRQGHTTAAQRHQTFNNLVLQGELRRAVRYITDRDQTTVLDPTGVTGKGDNVIDVLTSKHPGPQQILAQDLPSYPELPELVPLQVTDKALSMAARKLHGASGLGGTDAYSLKHWLFHYRAQSAQLRAALRNLIEWTSNELVPWGAIRALFSNRLLPFAKPDGGVRPIAIGQIWRRLMAKTVILITRAEPAEACGSLQLCCGLDSGVEGGIHAARQFWEAHSTEPEIGFLQVDADNAFNRLDKTAMLWVVRHEWPSGAMFIFNCYKHHAFLVIHGDSGELHSLLSQTGVAQGCPLSMFLYGLTLVPLIKKLQHLHPNCTQIFFADDGNAGGTWAQLRQYWSSLCKLGPQYGYFPNSTKTKLLVPEQSLQNAQSYLRLHRLQFQLKTGNRFLGGFIGNEAQFPEWLKEKTDTWLACLEDLEPLFQHHPQTAFTALQKSLQHEWQFIQRVNPCPPASFQKLEDSISQSLLPALFGQAPPERALTALPFKFAGLSIPDPTKTCTTNLEVSVEVTKLVVTTLLDPTTQFTVATNLQTVKEARATCTADANTRNETTLLALASTRDTAGKNQLERATLASRFLSVFPSYSNDTHLSAQEFRDRLHYRYGMQPSDLPTHCDGCNKPFSVDHAMSCSKGGLINARHNELIHAVGDLYTELKSPSSVQTEPMIYPPNEGKEDRGDLLLRGLFSNATDCIIDVTIVDLNAQTYRNRSTESVLKQKEREKKRHYLKPCQNQRRHFAPFVASTDGALGKEAKAILQTIAHRLSEKWQQPKSTVMSYISGKIAITLARACHRCLRGSRVPYQKMSYPFRPTSAGPSPPPGEFFL